MSRTNIISIVIDDLGARDLTCTGSTFYETPCIDRFARQGLLCEAAYASAPVCSPTRASLMTGRCPARVGITNYIGGHRRGPMLEAPYLHWLPLTERSIASELAAAGYQTWHVGKWHLGDEAFGPSAHGFQVNIGGCHLGHPHRGYVAPWGIPGLEDAAEGTWLTEHLTDRAIALLRDRDPARPFLLNLWHYAVHTPIQAPPALVEKYRRKAAALGLDRHDAFVDGGPMTVLPQRAGQQMDRIRRRVVQSDPVYAAMMEHLDSNIGRLLEAVRAAGLEDNTLVVFTSDNGGLSTAEGAPTCNAPLAEGKGWDREGGVRVCQAVRWPGRIPAGSRSDAPTWSCDLFPTMLAAAGLPLRPALHRDGIDMLPHWRGGPAERGRALCWHFPHYGNQGGMPASWIVQDGWKLVHRYGRSADELFALAADPSEACDVAGQEPHHLAALRSGLDAWLVDVHAHRPVADPDFERLKALVPAVADNACE
ncbi:MAG: sulfatase [Planctomycetes bacterium]|nr:sulfatase [Planctomycetota bacterium]